MYCHNCGAELAENAKFCTSCGQIVMTVPTMQDNSSGFSNSTQNTNGFNVNYVNCIGSIPVSQEICDRIDSLLGKNKRIEAIKVVRQATGLGLPEAKSFVENHTIGIWERAIANLTPGVTDSLPSGKNNTPQNGRTAPINQFNTTQFNGNVNGNTPKKKKGCLSWILTIFIALIALSVIGNIIGINNSKTSSVKQTAASNATPTPAQDSSPSVTATPKPVAQNVFYAYLLKDASSYNGKYVKTTFPVKSVLSSGDIESELVSGKRLVVPTGDRSLHDKEKSINYVTVTGVISGSGSYIKFSDFNLDYIGSDAPQEYQEDFAIYAANLKEERLQIRSDFIESAQTPSYEDLERYPDTYKGKALKLSIYVVEVESDGVIMNGIIRATYNGGDVHIYDDREVREPRLKAGDSITVYAEGDGLKTIKTYKEGSGLLGSELFGEVENERQIPYLRIRYTELDNLDAFGVDSVVARSVDDWDKRADELINSTNEWIDNFAAKAESMG